MNNSENSIKNNGRDEERIKRALAVRDIYDDVECPVIDTTFMSVDETVEKVLEILSYGKDVGKK